MKKLLFFHFIFLYSAQSFACQQLIKELHLNDQDSKCSEYIASGTLTFTFCPLDGINSVKDEGKKERYIYKQDNSYISRTNGYDFTNNIETSEFLKFDLTLGQFKADFKKGNELIQCEGEIY